MFPTFSRNINPLFQSPMCHFSCPLNLSPSGETASFYREETEGFIWGHHQLPASIQPHPLAPALVLPQSRDSLSSWQRSTLLPHVGSHVPRPSQKSDTLSHPLHLHSRSIQGDSENEIYFKRPQDNPSPLSQPVSLQTHF